MHRPLRTLHLALGLVFVISKRFYVPTTVRESREGSIARHLDREFAHQQVCKPHDPQLLTHAGEMNGGLTTREIGPGEAGV